MRLVQTAKSQMQQDETELYAVPGAEAEVHLLG